MNQTLSSSGLDLRRHISRLCDQLEFNWPDGGSSSVESLLQSVDLSERDACLTALLELEIDLRQANRETVAPDEYLARFPDQQDVVYSVFAELTQAQSQQAGMSTIESQEDVTSTGETCKRVTRMSVPSKFGRYRIRKKIGSGSMGSVLLAEDQVLERKVALKIPHFRGPNREEELIRFQREARTAAVLRHPNICPIYDIGEFEGTHYISMALIDGTPLSQTAAGGHLGERRIAKLIWKLARALQVAHENGIVHRDLKPTNVMVDSHGEPIVMDFGLAVQTQTADVRLTQAGMQIGSPAYMSPEQADGDLARVGVASDVYSLGVVMYELLTGFPPFRGPVISVFAQIVTQDPEPPSNARLDLTPELEDICLKMMSKQIEDRYQSMAEVADALTAYIRNELTSSLVEAEPSQSLTESDPDIAVGDWTHDAADDPELPPQPSDSNAEELRALMLDIETSLKHGEFRGLLTQVDRVLEIQSDNQAMQRLQQSLRNRDAVANRVTVSGLCRGLLTQSRWQIGVSVIVVLAAVVFWLLSVFTSPA